MGNLLRSGFLISGPIIHFYSMFICGCCKLKFSQLRQRFIVILSFLWSVSAFKLLIPFMYKYRIFTTCVCCRYMTFLFKFWLFGPAAAADQFFHIHISKPYICFFVVFSKRVLILKFGRYPGPTWARWAHPSVQSTVIQTLLRRGHIYEVTNRTPRHQNSRTTKIARARSAMGLTASPARSMASLAADLVQWGQRTLCRRKVN